MAYTVDIDVTTIKAHNLHDWIIGFLHKTATVHFDEMLMDGTVTQSERIAMSSAIGESLKAFDGSMGSNIPQFRQRARWDQAPDEDLSVPSEVMTEAGTFNRASFGDPTIKGVDAPLQILEEGEESTKIGGWLVLYGNKAEADLDGEWFEAGTKGMLDVFNHMGSLPFMYHHGADNAVKSTPVGTITDIIPTDLGLWYEAQLDRANKFSDAVTKLVKDGVLGTSSGALPGSVRKAKTGKIEQWAIVEGSGTVAPRDVRQRSHPLSVLSKATEFNPKSDDESKGSVELSIQQKLGELSLLSIDIN